MSLSSSFVPGSGLCSCCVPDPMGLSFLPPYGCQGNRTASVAALRMKAREHSEAVMQSANLLGAMSAGPGAGVGALSGVGLSSGGVARPAVGPPVGPPVDVSPGPWAEVEEGTLAPAPAWGTRAPCRATVLTNTLTVPRTRWRRSEELTASDCGGHGGRCGCTDSLKVFPCDRACAL